MVSLYFTVVAPFLWVVRNRWHVTGGATGQQQRRTPDPKAVMLGEHQSARHRVLNDVVTKGSYYNY